MSNNGHARTRVCAESTSQVNRPGDYFKALAALIQRIPASRVEDIAEVLLRAREDSKRVLLFGNGGSASLASHFACDLGKGTTARCCNPLKRFRAIALTDNIPMMTAWANDSSYDDIFSEQLRNLIEPGDVAFAISGSGNSPNVLKALETARAAGGFTVGLTGFQGGKMKKLCNLYLIVPSDNMQLIEDVHLSVAHALFTTIRHKLESALVDTTTSLAGVTP